MSWRRVVAYSLFVAIALGYEMALMSLVREPLILTWPPALIGRWLNARAARKSLRLLNAVSYWARDREMCE